MTIFCFRLIKQSIRYFVLGEHYISFHVYANLSRVLRAFFLNHQCAAPRSASLFRNIVEKTSVLSRKAESDGVIPNTVVVLKRGSIRRRERRKNRDGVSQSWESTGREREILSAAPLNGTTPFSFQAAMPRENLPPLHRVFAYRSIDHDIGGKWDRSWYTHAG